MIQIIRDWLDQQIVLSEVLTFAVMGGLLLLALAGLAGSFRRARKSVKPADLDRPEGFLARWFRTMRLAPGENLLLRAIFAAVAVLFAMALVTAFVLVGGVLWQAITAPGDTTPSASLGLGALLVALLGALFLIWRSLVAQRTLDTTRDGLVTDRINAAVASLGAEKEIKRQLKAADGTPLYEDDQSGQPDPKKPLFETVTLPNMEVRIGAIHALGRIARENLNFHVQIMEILCAYVRENAAAGGAMPYKPLKLLVNYIEEGLSAEAIQTYLAELHSGLDTLRKTLPKPRTDIQTALEVLGRRTPAQKRREGGWPDPDRDAPCNFDQPFPTPPPYPDGGSVEDRKGWSKKFADFRMAADELIAQFRTARTYRHDLRNTNLQDCDLSHLDLRGADLNGAQMQGADLSEAQMQGADLGWAQMQWANLSGAQMQGADLRGAQMQGADLGWAQMQGANLWKAQMQGANLRGAQMQGAHLWETQMQGANLREAQMQGANLNGAQMQGANLSEAQMQGADLSSAQLQRAELWEAQLQEADLRRAQMQGADLRGAWMEGASLFEADLQCVYLSNAQMQEADLRGARMEGANLFEIEMSEDTRTTGATLRGATLVFTDDVTTGQLRPHWDDFIAFLETLPEGAPDHWVQVAPGDLDFRTFIAQWRAWAATLDPPVTIAPDYRRD